MELTLVTLHVQDMEASLAFYAGLIGLKLAARQNTPNGELVFLGEGPTQLELIQATDAVSSPQGFSLGFAVQDMNKALQRLENAGVTLLNGPFSPLPGTTLAFVQGPDGEEVELVCRQATG